MPHHQIFIPNQTHTLASILRASIFENDATFAACIVPHPQDTALKVSVAHDADPKTCLLLALRDVRIELEQYLRVVRARRDADQMVVDDDTC